MENTYGDGQRLVALPRKIVETCFVELSTEERKCYDEIERQSQRAIAFIIDAGTLRHNHHTVLSFILRLRQICNGAAFCPSKIKSRPLGGNFQDLSKNPELQRKCLSMIEDGDDFYCPICLLQSWKVVITNCAHIFCKTCILEVLKGINAPCPLCRRPLSRSDLHFVPPIMLLKDYKDDLQKLVGRCLSAKGKKLLELVIASKEANPLIKSIIFSQFRKTLILLEEPLKTAGFRVLLLDGSMSMKKKNEVIQEFGKKGSGSSTILLVVLKATCARINLTAASRIYFVDPWWNRAIEEQAIGRVHQFGQKEKVRVTRLIVKDSIEERVLLHLQEHKKILADGLFGRKNSKLQEDIRTIMGL